jgi:hypothetical protein
MKTIFSVIGMITTVVMVTIGSQQYLLPNTPNAFVEREASVNGLASRAEPETGHDRPSAGDKASGSHPRLGIGVAANGQDGPRSITKGAPLESGAASGCADEHRNCPGWAGVGECTRNSKYMHNACRLSCGLCNVPTTASKVARSAGILHANVQSPPVAVAPPAVQPTQVRRLSEPTQVHAQVPAWPGLQHIAMSTGCADRHPRCNEYMGMGECTRNEPFMRVKCAATCGFCDPGSDNGSSSIHEPDNVDIAEELFTVDELDDPPMS